jgi:uncharacterized protein
MRLDTVLLKVASRCNINCSYCYVYNQGDTSWQRQPKVMSPETIQAVITSLQRLHEDQNADFAVVLHGGEPFLMPRPLLSALLEGLAEVIPSCVRCIQTNGMLIDDEGLDLCDATNTTLSVSLDGPLAVHDRFRVTFAGSGTFDSALAGIERIRNHSTAHRLFTGVLCVVDPTSNPGAVYNFFKELNVPSVDFLLKDGNYSKLPPDKHELASTEYGTWLAAVWDCYVADPNPPRIRILDDFARLLLGGQSIKEGCGQRLYGIAVIDTDGTVTKNDTLKSSFDGADRFAAHWSILSSRLSEIVATNEFRAYSQIQHPTSPICRSCEQLYVCGGGMPLSRWHEENGLNNPSIYCADYKYLIKHIQESLFETCTDDKSG